MNNIHFKFFSEHVILMINLSMRKSGITIKYLGYFHLFQNQCHNINNKQTKIIFNTKETQSRSRYAVTFVQSKSQNDLEIPFFSLQNEKKTVFQTSPLSRISPQNL